MAGTLALAVPATVGANGRFPAATELVVTPDPAGDVLVLRTTFGLVRSVDHGGTWRWVCESVLTPGMLTDPPVMVGPGGRTLVGVDTGLTASLDGCTWGSPPGGPAVTIQDMASDATGRHMVAAGGTLTGAAGLWVSDDGGATWRTGAALDGVLVATVEVAPGDPTRVYVTGNLTSTGAPTVVYRSDDGGMSVHEVARAVAGALALFIGAVDATHPDVVYARTIEPLASADASALLRSDDGGAHFQSITRTAAPMLGFALSDDGSTVWIGTADTQGVQRSVRGGPFTVVPGSVPVRCLRYHAGVLYLCADESRTPFSLGRSDDGGDHVTPVMALRDIAGPVNCAPGTPVADQCTARWPGQQAMFVPGTTMADGGTGTDAGTDAGTDGGMARATSQPAGCGCGVPHGWGPGLTELWVVLAGGYGRGRRRSRPRRVTTASTA